MSQVLNKYAEEVLSIPGQPPPKAILNGKISSNVGSILNHSCSAIMDSLSAFILCRSLETCHSYQGISPDSNKQIHLLDEFLRLFDLPVVTSSNVGIGVVATIVVSSRCRPNYSRRVFFAQDSFSCNLTLISPVLCPTGRWIKRLARLTTTRFTVPRQRNGRYTIT